MVEQEKTCCSYSKGMEDTENRADTKINRANLQINYFNHTLQDWSKGPRTLGSGEYLYLFWGPPQAGFRACSWLWTEELLSPDKAWGTIWDQNQISGMQGKHSTPVLSLWPQIKNTWKPNAKELRFKGYQECNEKEAITKLHNPFHWNSS